MRETESSLQQFGEFLLKRQLVRQQAGPQPQVHADAVRDCLTHLAARQRVSATRISRRDDLHPRREGTPQPRTESPRHPPQPPSPVNASEPDDALDQQAATFPHATRAVIR